MMIAKLKSRNVRARQTMLLAAASLLPLVASTAYSQAPTFPTAAPPAAASDSKVERYPLNAATRDILSAWQQQVANRTDIRIALDERTGQALVFAPAAVQAQIQQQLTAPPVAAPVQQPVQQPTQQAIQPPVFAAPAAAPPVVTPNVATVPNVGLTVPGNAVLFQLRQIPAGEVHARLENVLGRALPGTVDASGEWQSFPVEAAPGAGVMMSVNIRSAQVRLDGPPTQVAAWRSVIEALDSPPTSPDRVTKLVSTRPNTHDRVRQALQVLQTDSATRSPGSPAMISTVSQLQGRPAADMLAQATTPQAPAAAPAAAPVAPAAPAPTSQVAPGAAAQTAQDAIKLAEAAGGLLGPVQVEFVEGLDVIVLRGSERDVQRVMEIIKQIEDLSAVTVPDIEVYPLKYVDSVRMSVLLEKLYEVILRQRSGAVTIVPLGTPNALLLIGRTDNVKSAIDLVQKLDQPVVPTSQFEVFSLKHATASEAKTLIDEFFGQSATTSGSSGGSTTTRSTGGTSASTAINPMDLASSAALDPKATVVADQRTNSLIVIASPRDIAQVAALVQRIDTPGAAAELKVFTIVNGDAQALMEMLRSLFSVPSESQGGGGGGNQNNPNSGGGGGALGQASPVRMQFSVDTRTNSIVAVGTREDLAVVEAILLRLDEGDLRERQTIVYRLNNAFAQNVAQAINAWLQTERQNEQQTEVTLSPFEEIEKQVIIEPEFATNSLIVSATPRYFNEVMKVIKDLDERPPMVLIQVLIAQVQLNDTDQFGVELGLQDSVLFDRSLLADGVQTNPTTTTNQTAGGATTTTDSAQIISANGQPGFNWNTPTAQPLGNNLSAGALATAGRVGTQGLTNFAVNRVDPSLGFSGFVFSASSDAVSMLLRALQEKRRLEVLSRPQIMALDGQPGAVQVGQDVPTVTGVSLTQFGQTNNIVYRSVGLILQVVPHISPDGLVVMQIIANKSQVSGDPGIPISIAAGGQIVSAPRIDVSQAQTTISAVSGQTVVLGGLIETTKNDIHRRVPIIADIPLIGDLFRYDSVSEERRELMIIMTPQIIYTKMDSDLTKQIETSRMSWVLSDVLNIHGEAGLRSRCDEWCDGEMESLYPSVVPEEGFLPLSSHKFGPDGQMEMCAPGTTQPMPAGVTLPPTMSEPLPTPATRQSPGPARPTNEPYKTTDASQQMVRPVSYQSTAVQPPPITTYP